GSRGAFAVGVAVGSSSVGVGRGTVAVGSRGAVAVAERGVDAVEVGEGDVGITVSAVIIGPLVADAIANAVGFPAGSASALKIRVPSAYAAAPSAPATRAPTKTRATNPAARGVERSCRERTRKPTG